jgi:transcriptional regulator of acetoin/glycerol metabolism
MNDEKVLVFAQWGLRNEGCYILEWERKTLKEQKEAIEKEYIYQTLIRNKWNVSRSSKELGISRWTLHNKKKKYNIRRPI